MLFSKNQQFIIVNGTNQQVQTFQLAAKVDNTGEFVRWTHSLQSDNCALGFEEWEIRELRDLLNEVLGE